MNIGKICHGTMLSPKGNNLETIGVMGKCKDFLCPPEHFIREMFQNSFAGRLRAKALDPYGTMVAQIYGKRKDNGTEASWTCKNVNCHAKLILRTVKPDNEGNLYGLFGCFSHQHEMPREDRAQIVFKNRMECQEFYDKNLRMLYGKGQSKGQREKNNIYFPCRRRGLGATKDTRTTGIHDPNCGYIDCTSTFTMRTVFRGNPKDLESVPVEERPHCFSGIFFHNHENDERYHRLDNTDETNHLDAQRKWKRHKNSPTPKHKRQRKSYYIPKKKRLDLGIDSNSKSKIRGRPKKNQTEGTSMSSDPHWLQVERLENKEEFETAETELGLESNIKVIKIRGRPKKKQ